MNWTQLVLVPAPMDGHCLFHAICHSFFKAYRDNAATRHDTVVKLRGELANLLTEPHPRANGRTYYQVMGNGHIKELGDQNISEYTLTGMQQWLRGSESMGDEVIDFISDVLNKDIYFLDIRTQDVYVTPVVPTGTRSSIVLFYNGHHYDLATYREHDQSLTSHFQPYHPLISDLRARLLRLKK